MFDKYINLSTNDIFFFAKATGLTIFLSLVTIATGTLIGVIIGIMRSSKNKAVSMFPLIYIEPFRNSPLITQLFLIFFGIPMISRWFPSQFTAAFIALSLNTGAFFSVIVYNSIKAIPRSQWETSYALGFNKFQTAFLIILPQTIRLMIPPSITLYIGQFQVSSVVSLIGLIDITRAGQIVTLRTFKPFIVWGIVFAIYFAVSFPLSKLAARMEKKFGHAL